jgi:hypothetical protein
LDYSKTNEFPFNLKGFIVGNPVTNWTLMNPPTTPDVAWWHLLYGRETREQYEQDCI